MRNITKEMIKEFKIYKLGYDFMGYTFINKNELSFHHLIVPHKDCKKSGLGEGYLKWNGAILNQSTSHDYLHIIQAIDNELFQRITDEMIEENLKNKLDLDNLKKIRDYLLYFEKEHDKDKNRNGKLLIKENYLNKRIIL